MGTLPRVSITILQNSLGLQNPSAGDGLAIIGPAPLATLAANTPQLYGRTTTAKADLGELGPLTEAGACGLELTGRPVVLVVCDTTTAGAQANLDTDGVTGTAEVALTSEAEPIDDYEPYIEIVDGGDVGTTGITYRWSDDGGRYMSPVTALGTAVVLTLPGSRGVSFDLDPPEAGLVALVNELRTDMIAHFALTAGGVHGAADSSSGAGIGSAATDTASAITLVNQLRTAYAAHRVLTAGTVHGAADATNVVSAAAATTAHQAVDLANEIKTDFNAHRVLTAGSVHGAADNTNVVSGNDASHGTLEAGDFWSCTTSAPKPSDAQIDAALAALASSTLTWKTLLILSPITSSNTVSSLETRLAAMQEQYKFKKLFGYFRVPNVGESEAQYLTAFKAVFDSATLFQLSVSAGAVEFQSCAQRPRIYKRPPAWLAAPLHIKLGPAVSLAFVNDGAGALPLGATITDENGNPKHHNEELDPGLDAARALTLRSVPGYPGRVFFTRPRTLAQLGTDFATVQNWAVAVEMLDAVVPKLVGRLGDAIALNTTTGLIAEEEALDIEAVCGHEAEIRVFSRGWASNPTDSDPESKVIVIDRTANLLSDPEIPVTLSYVPLSYVDRFALTLALKNPALSNS